MLDTGHRHIDRGKDRALALLGEVAETADALRDGGRRNDMPPRSFLALCLSMTRVLMDDPRFDPGVKSAAAELSAELSRSLDDRTACPGCGFCAGMAELARLALKGLGA